MQSKLRFRLRNKDPPYLRPERSKRFYITVAAAITAVAIILTGAFILTNLHPAHQKSYYGPGPIEIKVQPDKPFFVVGELVNFTVTVVNNQNWPVASPSFQGTIIEKDGVRIGGGGMHIDYPPNRPTYPANASTPYTWTWYPNRQNNQTVPHEPGNYALTYHLEGFGYDATANCTFELRR